MQRPNHCRCGKGPYLQIHHKPRSLLPPRFQDDRPQTLSILCLDCGTLFRTQAREHQQHPYAPSNWKALPTNALFAHWQARSQPATTPAEPPPQPQPTQPPEPVHAEQPAAAV